MHFDEAETTSYPPKFVLPLFLSNRVTEITGLPNQRLHFPALFQPGDYEATNGTLNTLHVCPPTLPFLPAGIRIYTESAVLTTQITVALGDNEIT